MKGRVLVAGEANQPGFSLLLGSIQGFDYAAFGIGQVGIVIITDGVNLPQIQVIGLQASQGLLEHPHGFIGTAAVRANLGHDKSPIAMAFQASAQEVLGLAIVIFPAVVEKINAGIQGFMDKLDRLVGIFKISKMMSSNSESGNLEPVATQSAPGNLARTSRRAL